MRVTVTRLYDDYSTARQVVTDLENAGLSSSDISIVANNATNTFAPSKTTTKDTKKVDRDFDGVDDRAQAAGDGAGTGASIGAVIAGGAGLLAGLGMIAIPGLGPVVAAGWLIATAVGVGTGAAVGAGAGALIGALTQAGLPEEEAEVYVEGVRRGGTLVSAHVPSDSRARYEAVMDRSAVNIAERSETYRSSGWSGFDPEAAPYTPDEIRKERPPSARTGW